MKKFAFLILSVLLFAGCNNMLTNPDAYNVEDAHVSIDVSKIQARNAGAGNVITSTLDFVGEEPKHAPFEKTQTVSGGTIDYTIKGLPVGATVQFKLSVFRNGLLLCEGISKKITIKEKNALSILLNKKNNWIFLPLSVYSNGEILESKTYNVDLSASEIDYNMGNTTLTSYSCFCTDDKGNVYVSLNENQGIEIIRSTLPYVGDQVTLVNLGSSIINIEQMKYDVSTDTLYYQDYQDSANKLYSVPNASTSFQTEPSEPINGPTNNAQFAIYNGYLYYIESDYPKTSTFAKICRQPLNAETHDESMTLFQVDKGENEPVYSGEIVEPLKETFNNSRFNVEITDLAVTNEGVFV